jgi:GNAT superfamily N-acetyltransferase
MKNPFENFKPRELSEKETEILESLKQIEGAEVTPGIRAVYSYALRFVNDELMVSVYLSFFDEASGADMAITNITNLPTKKEYDAEYFRGQGLGTEVIQRVITWSKEQGYEHIIATQVQESAKGFWVKNGFVYDERENNVSEDWIYKGENQIDIAEV